MGGHVRTRPPPEHVFVVVREAHAGAGAGAGAGARAVWVEPRVVAAALRRWPRRRRRQDDHAQVPLQVDRAVVQLSLHVVVVHLRLQQHQQEETEERGGGRRAGRRDQEATFVGTWQRGEAVDARAVQQQQGQNAAAVPELGLLPGGDPAGHQQFLAVAQDRAGRLRRRVQGRPPRRHAGRRQARQSADAEPARGRGVPERGEDHGAHRAPEPRPLLRLPRVRPGEDRRRRVRPQRHAQGAPRHVQREVLGLRREAGGRHRRGARSDVPAHVLRPPHHPPRHQVVQHPAHALAARQGGRLRVRAAGRRGGLRRRRDARDDAGEGHGGVPRPGVPEDVPADRPERRLLLRCAPGGDGVRSPPHRDEAADEGAADRPVGHEKVHRGRGGGRAGPAVGADGSDGARGGDGAGAGVPVPGPGEAGQAEHERLLQGAVGRQEDVQGQGAGRRRRDAAAVTVSVSVRPSQLDQRCHRRQERRPDLEELNMPSPHSAN